MNEKEKTFKIMGVEVINPSMGIFRVRTDSNDKLDRVRKYLVAEGFKPWIVAMDGPSDSGQGALLKPLLKR